MAQKGEMTRNNLILKYTQKFLPYSNRPELYFCFPGIDL